MLRYKINNSNNSLNNKLVVNNMTKIPVLYNENMDENELISLYVNDINQIDLNKTLYITKEIYFNENKYIYKDIIKPESINTIYSYFSFIKPKYYRLYGDKAFLTSDGRIFNILFKGYHFFNKEDKAKIRFKYTIDNDVVYCDLTMDYSSMMELSIQTEKVPIELLNELFKGNNNTVSIVKYIILRDNIIYNDYKDINLYIDKNVFTFKIPLCQNFETNLYQTENNIEFIKEEKNKSINRIIDLEKDIYKPVIWDSIKNKLIDDIFNIRINLHFREHRGNDWIANPESYWNGTYLDENGILKLMNDSNSFGNSSDKSNIGYFSYKNKSEQSDLLSYLNYNNNDIKNQKNVLTKSFLRLMFFDSPNKTNQNLLYYSTIFFDTGKLFTKYIKHIKSYPYSMNVFNDNGDYNKTNGNFTGIRVNREPYGKLLEMNNDVEDYRLSSQVNTYDRFISNNSSDGFYLYLWKDINNMTIPNDVYLNIEFNHAGFGRTIPFMMPYFDDDNNKGIKTFEDIVDDWNNGGYNVQKYMKYSYIKLKTKYDVNKNKFIYYLDDNVYGKYYTGNNILTLNLYEAKMI